MQLVTHARRVVVMMLVLSGGLVALLVGSSTAQAATPRSSLSELRADMRSYLQSVADDRAMNATWLVAIGDRIVLNDAFGYLDAGTHTRPLKANTLFPINSITKTITATAVLRLVDKGKIDLDAPISTYLPDVPAEEAPITPRQLLTMTSGIVEHFTFDSPGIPGDFQPYQTMDAALAEIWNQPLVFAPGTDEAYSNAGYTVLAAIIESVTGKPYTKWIENHVLDRLDMDRTGVYGEAVAPASQYSLVATNPTTPEGPDMGYGRNARYWPLTYGLAGSAGYVSTVRDLFNLTEEYCQPDLLEPASALLAYESPNDNFTHGWRMLAGSFFGRPEFGSAWFKTGADDFGDNSIAFRYTDLDVTFISLTNNYNFPPTTSGMRHRLFEIMAENGWLPQPTSHPTRCIA